MMFWRRVQKWARKILRSVPETVPPERGIVQRVNTEFGENVRLECGHSVSMIYHRMQSLKCHECLDTCGERPDSPDIPPEAGSPTPK